VNAAGVKSPQLDKGAVPIRTALGRVPEKELVTPNGVTHEHVIFTY
jgi:hypothetical protein